MDLRTSPRGVPGIPPACALRILRDTSVTNNLNAGYHVANVMLTYPTD